MAELLMGRRPHSWLQPPAAHHLPAPEEVALVWLGASGLIPGTPTASGRGWGQRQPAMPWLGPAVL